MSSVFFFFFFQAEDGIRDLTVTGVQTCALPIWNQVDQQRRDPVNKFLRLRKRTYVLGHLRMASGKDRKSTRLNSSHSQISYAVFCLKKKKNTNDPLAKYRLKKTLAKIHLMPSTN